MMFAIYILNVVVLKKYISIQLYKGTIMNIIFLKYNISKYVNIKLLSLCNMTCKMKFVCIKML